MAVLPQRHAASDDPGALPRPRSLLQPASADHRSLGLRAPRGRRTAPCPWCQHPLPPVCCAKCLNKASAGTKTLGDAIEASQHPFKVSLAKLGHRVALREKHAMLAERVAELRASAERRAASLRERRLQLERRKELHRQRRQSHEKQAADCAVARRRLEAGRIRMSLNEFLRNPKQHGAHLGAFHKYNELSSLGDALRAERRRRCDELVKIFPLKFIGSSGAAGDSTVTLGQVQSFTVAGVLLDELLKDLEAALSFLTSLVSLLATYLDVTLPFPCIVGQGYTEPCSTNDGTSDSSRATQSGGRSRTQGPGVHNSWVRPSVFHPFKELGLMFGPRGDGWRYFSIYDGMCTSEFAMALSLIDEDLRSLCLCQGTEAPANLNTLQLLSHCLGAANLGCLCPPATQIVESQTSGSASMAETADAGASTAISAAEDSEWMVVDHG